ncbi:MAG: hypothetical protein EOO88_01130 [Pedobacter sp.]|nr:MAG: hypothetical protein EOO88_01130 [Pedobacter sp.]
MTGLPAIFLLFSIGFSTALRSQPSVAPERAIADTHCTYLSQFCTVKGLPEPSISQVYDLVNAGHSKQLVHWLHSADPQDQVHGYIGIWLLKKKKGFVPTLAMLERMMDIEHSIDFVNFCMSGYSERYGLVGTAVTSRNLQSHYRQYKKHWPR